MTTFYLHFLWLVLTVTLAVNICSLNSLYKLSYVIGSYQESWRNVVELCQYINVRVFYNYRTAVTGVTHTASIRLPATRQRVWKHHCCQTPRWYRPGSIKNGSYSTGMWCVTNGMAGPGFHRPTVVQSARVVRSS